MVPTSLTTISSGPVDLYRGRTRLNHSTLTRSDSFTTNGQLLKSTRSFHRSPVVVIDPVSILEGRSGGTLPASCNNATSASIASSSFQGALLLQIFQHTTVVTDLLTHPPSPRTPQSLPLLQAHRSPGENRALRLARCAAGNRSCGSRPFRAC